VLTWNSAAGWLQNGRGSNQGNTQNEKSPYYQSSIDFRCYLELELFEPRRLTVAETSNHIGIRNVPDQRGYRPRRDYVPMFSVRELTLIFELRTLRSFA